jgi:hypothetical protein
VQLDGDSLTVTNHTKDFSLTGAPIPPAMLAILREGGIVPYVRLHRSLESIRT